MYTIINIQKVFLFLTAGRVSANQDQGDGKRKLAEIQGRSRNA